MKQRKMLMIRKAFLVIAMGLQISQARTPTEILKELQDSSAKVLNKIDTTTSPIKSLSNAIEVCRTGNIQEMGRSIDFALSIANIVFEDDTTEKCSDARLESLGNIDGIKKDIMSKTNAQIFKLKASATQCLDEMRDKLQTTNCTSDQFKRAQKLCNLIDDGCKFYQRLANTYASLFDKLTDIDNFDSTSTTKAIGNAKSFLKGNTLLWLEDPAYQNTNLFGSQLEPMLSCIRAMKGAVKPLHAQALEFILLDGGVVKANRKYPELKETLSKTKNLIPKLNSHVKWISYFLIKQDNPFAQITVIEVNNLANVYQEYSKASEKLVGILEQDLISNTDKVYLTQLASSLPSLKARWKGSLNKVTFRKENLLEKYFAKESLLKGLNKVTLGN